MGSQDLPTPPHGKVFRPLLKSGWEIVLPVAALVGRYYGEIENDDLVHRSHARSLGSTTPTTFCSSRAKMVEYAYTSGRTQALHTMARVDEAA